MRSSPAVSLSTLAVCLLLGACNQRSPDPTLPTVDAEVTRIKRYNGDLAIRSAWASSPTDIYAGRTGLEMHGDVGLVGKPLVRHFDGNRWTDVDLPIDDEGGTPDIWGTAADNVYAAVDKLYHFNGSEWKMELDRVQLVSGSAPDNVFAANGVTIFHFDGAAWDTLLVAPPNRYFRSIFAAPDGALWVSASDSILVLTGSSTRVIPRSQSYGDEIIDPFSATDAISIISTEGDYYFYDPKTDVRRWLNGKWQVESTVPALLNTMWAENPSSLYAVGRYGTAWHFAGGQWKELPRPTSFELSAIAGLGAGHILAAGASGKVVDFDGSAWSTLREGLLGGVDRIWAESATRYVASYYGVIFRQNDSQWSELVAPFSSGIAGFGGASINNLFFASNDSLIYHYDGNNWSLSDSLAGPQYDFWTASGGAMVTAGYQSVYRFDGSWRRILGGEFVMDRVAADERGHILCEGTSLVTRGNVVKYFNGSSWSDMPRPADYLLDAWISPEGDRYLAGSRGLYRWNGEKFARVTPARSQGAIDIIGRDGRVLGFAYDEMIVYDGGIANLQASSLRHPVVQARDGSIIGDMGRGLGVWK
jgi:hypothetical protein